MQPLLPSLSVPRCQGRSSRDATQGQRAQQSLAGRGTSGDGPSALQTEEESAGRCAEGKGGEEEVQRSQEGRGRAGHRKDFCSSSHSHLLLFLASPQQKRCQRTTSRVFLERERWRQLPENRGCFKYGPTTPILCSKPGAQPQGGCQQGPPCGGPQDGPLGAALLLRLWPYLAASQVPFSTLFYGRARLWLSWPGKHEALPRENQAGLLLNETVDACSERGWQGQNRPGGTVERSAAMRCRGQIPGSPSATSSTQ